VKFIIMQFSPWSVFLPFRSKYLPHSSQPKTFLEDWGRKRPTPARWWW
jgi:hypothetical protein